MGRDPEELEADKIEKYVYGLMVKKNISASYQRMVVADIDKFYTLAINVLLPIKHLYPTRKELHLPKYLNKNEIKRWRICAVRDCGAVNLSPVTELGCGD